MMEIRYPTSVGNQLFTNGPLSRLGAFCYDNVNYHFLCAILERVYGTTIGDVWSREVFDPLGMQHSRPTGRTLAERRIGEVLYFGTRFWGPNRTLRHPGSDPGWKRTWTNQISNDPPRAPQGYGGDRDYHLTVGSDGLLSNVVDMVKHARALRVDGASLRNVQRLGTTGASRIPLYGSALMGPNSLANMWLGGSAANPPIHTGYGYGLQAPLTFIRSTGTSTSTDPYATWHGGDAPGVHAFIQAQNDLAPTKAAQGLAFAAVFNRYRGWNSNRGGLMRSPRFGTVLSSWLNSPPGLSGGPGSTSAGGRLTGLDGMYFVIETSTDDLFDRYS